MIWLVFVALLGIMLLWWDIRKTPEAAVERLIKCLPEELPAADNLSIPAADRPEPAYRITPSSQDITAPVHNLLLIEYVDAKGHWSKRRITVSAAWKLHGPEPDYSLSAYCHERRAPRSFYASRIKSMIDMQTGEIIANPLLYFDEMFPPEKPNPLTVALEVLEAELLILIFMARCDKKMVKTERAAISEFVRSSLPTLALEDYALSEKLKRLTCMDSEFKWACKMLRDKPPESRQAVMRAADAVVAADNKRLDVEINLLDELRVAIAA